MKIRKEDKRLVHNLALLGALIASCAAVWLTHQRISRTQTLLAEETSFIRDTSAASKLNPETLAPAPDLAKNLINTISAELSDSQARLDKLHSSLWVNLPVWLLMSGAALLGALLGYCGIRLVIGVVSVVLYAGIRALYRLIRAVDPDCPAAVMITTGNIVPVVQRDSGRVLPVLIKLAVLLILSMVLLAVLVWQWTSIPST